MACRHVCEALGNTGKELAAGSRIVLPATGIGQPPPTLRPYGMLLITLGEV